MPPRDEPKLMSEAMEGCDTARTEEILVTGPTERLGDALNHLEATGFNVHDLTARKNRFELVVRRVLPIDQ